MERFGRAVDRFEKAFRKFEEAVRGKGLEGFIPNEDVLVEVVVKRFEYTFEALWKASREFLRTRGIECYSPKSCFGSLMKEGMVPEDMEAVLKEIVGIRNELVHVYDDLRARQLYEKIKSEEIYQVFKTLLKVLKKQVEG